METKAIIEANVKDCSLENIVIELNIPLVRSMPSGEEVIQHALNAAGNLATRALLKSFDTDGSAIQIASLNLTSKGPVLKE